jgi:hypothetical protein
LSSKRHLLQSELFLDGSVNVDLLFALAFNGREPGMTVRCGIFGKFSSAIKILLSVMMPHRGQHNFQRRNAFRTGFSGNRLALFGRRPLLASRPGSFTATRHFDFL